MYGIPPLVLVYSQVAGEHKKRKRPKKHYVFSKGVVKEPTTQAHGSPCRLAEENLKKVHTVHYVCVSLLAHETTINKGRNAKKQNPDTLTRDQILLPKGQNVARILSPHALGFNYASTKAAILAFFGSFSLGALHLFRRRQFLATRSPPLVSPLSRVCPFVVVLFFRGGLLL